MLSTEEMRRFLIQAKYEGYYELFLLELVTGLRCGELVSLQWADLNFTTGELKIDKQVYRVDGKLTVTPPKTKASIRTVIIPQAVCEVLKRRKEKSGSRWIFPSPRLEDTPIDPAWCRKKLQKILAHANCKKVRFHDLRHTFCTAALANGMDIKTLSTIIGHVSAATTLDIYTHSTDDMKRRAAEQIDKGFGRGAKDGEEVAPLTTQKPTESEFEPYKGKRRRSGTGCVSKINDSLWKGQYSPTWIDGKKRSRNVYANTLSECEEKLAVLIDDMKAELAELKENVKAG